MKITVEPSSVPSTSVSFASGLNVTGESSFVVGESFVAVGESLTSLTDIKILAEVVAPSLSATSYVTAVVVPENSLPG
ncbi:MAG: hypothetical protein R3C28_31205 [Pirellulaceae bacterium]